MINLSAFFTTTVDYVENPQEPSQFPCIVRLSVTVKAYLERGGLWHTAKGFVVSWLPPWQDKT